MIYGIRIAGCGLLRGIISCVLLMALFAGAQEPGMEVSGFRVPDYNEQGEMTSQLFGDRAEMQGGGDVKVTGVNMEFYKAGEVYMTVTSPHCFFNQKTRKAHSDAAIAADMEGIRVRGRGFTLSSSDRTVQILNDSEVVIEDDVKPASTPEKRVKSGKVTVITSKELYLDYNGQTVRFEKAVHVQDPKMTMDCGTLNVRFNDQNEIDWIEAWTDVMLENGVTVITSEKLYFDYRGKSVRFENSVHVKDPKMTMDCGTLNIRFDENNEINWIEALTEVKLSNEGREAHAGRAVFDVSNDEFLLEDDPRILDGKNMLLGEKIRFWRASNRMECEPSARLIIYQNNESKFDFFEK